MNRSSAVRYAFRASLPVMAGYMVLGMGFGILLYSHGYAWWWSTLASVTIYAGSLQYVCIDLLATGANLITVALVSFMVNVRHVFYGITMLDRYKKTGAERPYLIFALTDETFSLVCSPELPPEVDRHGYYFWVSLFDQSYWVIGSTIGALLGTAFTFNSAGVDFSMTALFVVIFVEQWEKAENHLPSLIGVGVSLTCLLLFGADSFLIPSMLVITMLLLGFRKKLEISREEVTMEDD